MNPPIPLRIERITIRYPNGKTAVREISLEVPPGEVFGLVGPNGAGKSTLLKCAAGLVRPLSGDIFCGETPVTGDPARTACFLSFMPDPLGVYNDLDGGEYLEFFARTLRIPRQERARRIDAVVERLGLRPWLGLEVEALSAGWQRRLALGRALLSEAPILLLDEPAAGLDSAAREELLGVVRGLASERRAIVITSHILPELQELASRFGVIRDGAWAALPDGQPFFTAADLRGNFGAARCRIACSEPARAADALRAARPGLGAGIGLLEDGLSFAAADREETADAAAVLVGAGIRVYEVCPESRTLADVALGLLKS
jgi:ABC-2 type transport system ATP-binding protein